MVEAERVAHLLAENVLTGVWVVVRPARPEVVIVYGRDRGGDRRPAYFDDGDAEPSVRTVIETADLDDADGSVHVQWVVTAVGSVGTADAQVENVRLVPVRLDVD